MTNPAHFSSRVVQPTATHRLRNPLPGKIWRVIHACEFARDMLPVVEAQIAVNMRPFIVTPQGAGRAELYLSGRQLEQPRGLSLLRSWQDVRNWRKSIVECDPEDSADLVHAHSFAAGMAAVRNVSCVVYDLCACIEHLAMAARQAEPGSWMARSFRVAEQFVISRAAAVIVHSALMRQAALARGAWPENVFLIPRPIPLPAADQTGYQLALGRKYAEAYRHAASRRKFTGTGQGLACLRPAANWG